ncbi:hypothetical protein GOP47_0028273 [Adiantum capillus-veneris]|nr:hypothetical protein GOP47_0028273 [Adiantum capillus-veneris]
MHTTYWKEVGTHCHTGELLDLDLIFDIVPEADLVKRKGKPWRGGCQRGQKLVKHVIMFERDERIYDRLLKPFGVKMD